MKISFYVRNNKKPVRDFIMKLERKDRLKVLGCLESVEQCGLNSPRVGFRQIDGKLWEIKIVTQGGGVRIFYVMLRVDEIRLLHAYKKKSRKAPTKEIRVALRRMKEVIENEFRK